MTMTKSRVRKLRNEDAGKSKPDAPGKPHRTIAETEEAVEPSGLVFVASKKPAPIEEAAKDEPILDSPGQVPCEETPPVVDTPAKVPSSMERAQESFVDLSRPLAEFSLRIGSLEQARESIIRSYMMLVLWPMLIGLTILVVVTARETGEAEGMIAALEFILGANIALGIPLMAASWFHGFYPKGSYGRFVAGSALASFLVLWLVLVLVVSDLQSAVESLGAELKLEWVFILICLSPVFYFGAAVSEIVDDRAAWMWKLGVETKETPLNLRSRFVDFDRRVGKFDKGRSKALRAYVKFLVIPMILLVGADYVLNRLDLQAKDMILSSVGSMFGTVLSFGTCMVVIRFLHGFYPCGSVSRPVFGLLGVLVMILFAWAVLINSGLEGELDQNGFFIEMSFVMLPVLMFVGFIAVFEVSELKDCRRSYRRSVGLPVRPYNPGELYSRRDDFRTFYASFSNGSSKGRLILYKYALQILIIVILVAIGVSVHESPNAGDLSETTRPYLSPEYLDDRMEGMIFVLVVLAAANTFWGFLAWSYREGSFARLLLSGVVALVASQWAYSFWSTLAKIIQSGFVTEVINYIMFSALGFIIMRAIREVYKGYLMGRNKYLDWRLVALRDEASYGRSAEAPQGPSSAKAPPRSVNGRGA